MTINLIFVYFLAMMDLTEFTTSLSNHVNMKVFSANNTSTKVPIFGAYLPTIWTLKF